MPFRRTLTAEEKRLQERARIDKYMRKGSLFPSRKPESSTRLEVGAREAAKLRGKYTPSVMEQLTGAMTQKKKKKKR